MSYMTRSSMVEHKEWWDPRSPHTQPRWKQVTSQKLSSDVRQLQMLTFLLSECHEAHDSSKRLSTCLLLYRRYLCTAAFCNVSAL